MDVFEDLLIKTIETQKMNVREADVELDVAILLAILLYKVISKRKHYLYTQRRMDEYFRNFMFIP